MKIERHGISIGIERAENQFFLVLKAKGKLTHEDFEKITPMIDAALEKVDKPVVNIFVDGSELEGWEARAAWDDFKFGLKHGSEIEKVAIYGNRKWQDLAAKVGSWFISGNVKHFDDENEAIDWVFQPA
ncbi:SpoIIAA family protein [Salinibius halmophilus]|uniref:STAS/SEC14 domain-containing protein n=1 Tax=Salinibius halmophilus TaxID=1853216 RepID=UPI000E6758CE|nr:STAS/SEC14 domain-containing protein [Salinibius halmophilus]